MIVVTKDAEKRALSEIQYCEKHSPGNRVFHYAFSLLNLSKETTFTQFLRIFGETQESSRAKIYLCHDGDILLFVPSLALRNLDKMSAQLETALNIDTLKPHIHAYEIKQHWNVLEVMCSQKLAIVNEKSDTTQRLEIEETERQTTLQTLEQIDTEQIINLAERREKRDHPVIAIIDDDQLIRALITNVLGKDYVFSVGTNGTDGLIEYVTYAPDILFLDIGLPDISGYAVLEQIMQIDPNAYVIILSGQSKKENILHALELGAQGFIAKPFTRAKLFDYIQKSPFIKTKLERINQNAKPTVRTS